MIMMVILWFVQSLLKTFLQSWMINKEVCIWWPKKNRTWWAYQKTGLLDCACVTKDTFMNPVMLPDLEEVLDAILKKVAALVFCDN